MKLRLAASTERYVDTFTRNRPQAILLTGPVGIGLSTLAAHLVRSAGQPIATVRPQSKTSVSIPTIPVERIRELYVEARARRDTPGFIVIDDADSMSVAAQNALLKLLEEPNGSTYFILTSHAPDSLLPTIRSRVQTFAVQPITLLESKRLLKALGVNDPVLERRLLYVAEGLPAELTRLTDGTTDFKTLSERVMTARSFIEGTPYQRLCLIQTMPTDRVGALTFIATVTMLLRRTLGTEPDIRPIGLIDRLIDADASIRANGNVRLHLSDAVV